jgi:hypothetical protein
VHSPYDVSFVLPGVLADTNVRKHCTGEAKGDHLPRTSVNEESLVRLLVPKVSLTRLRTPTDTSVLRLRPTMSNGADLRQVVSVLWTNETC